jgi:hypothetical protein
VTTDDQVISLLVGNLSAIWCTCTGETDVQDAMTDAENLAEIERIADETLREYEAMFPTGRSIVLCSEDPRP